MYANDSPQGELPNTAFFCLALLGDVHPFQLVLWRLASVGVQLCNYIIYVINNMFPKLGQRKQC